jgi:hypothetical protein
VIKNIVFLITILSFFLPFCQGQSKEKNIKVDTVQLYFRTDFFNRNKEKADTIQLYFPLGIIDSASTLPRFCWHAPYYSGVLYTMKEPVIYTDTSHNEIYRFSWLRSHDHPVIIRIEKQDCKYMLYWKYYSWKYYEDVWSNPEKCLMIVKQKEVDENTWNEFKHLLTQVDFWNLATTKNDGLNLHGAQWILEGKKNSQYHVVDRWSPHKKSKYYQCCDFLIKLTDLRMPNRNKY